MNSLILVIAFVGCAMAQIRPYRPLPQPQAQFVPSNPASVIGIRSQSQNVEYDGRYQYSFETENGIAAQEQGEPKNVPEGEAVVSQGQYSYTAPDGTPVAIQYVANENGFQPTGNVLPTPPPIPEAILRSLEYNARNPEPELPQRRYK